MFINGKRYGGPRTPEEIGAAVDEARRVADEVIKKREATVDGYYDHIMKTAQRSL